MSDINLIEFLTYRLPYYQLIRVYAENDTEVPMYEGDVPGFFRAYTGEELERISLASVDKVLTTTDTAGILSIYTIDLDVAE